MSFGGKKYEKGMGKGGKCKKRRNGKEKERRGRKRERRKQKGKINKK
jgi:hypothetical protein